MELKSLSIILRLLFLENLYNKFKSLSDMKFYFSFNMILPSTSNYIKRQQLHLMIYKFPVQ